jgi:NTE family protein
MSAESKTAVVLSGGGADGAYGVGVLKALCGGLSPATDFEPLNPDAFTGTSIGSFNAAFLASQWDEYGPAAVANLETVWLDRLGADRRSCGNGIFRIRGNPAELFDPACFLPDPLAPLGRLASDAAALGWEALRRTVHAVTLADVSLAQRSLPFISLAPFVDTGRMQSLLREVIDYKALRASSRTLRVVAVEWTTGALREFGNRDMTDVTGPEVIAGSSAVPGFFPPVMIGAHPFVDGGVLMQTPLRPAIRTGATELHVVYHDPDVANIPLAATDSLPETAVRMQQISWAKTVNQDIKRAERLNEGLTALIEKARDTPPEELDELLEATSEIRRRLLDKGRPLRLLTIHRYRPHGPLSQGLEFMNFDRDHIEDLIERGFEDAVHHDHAASGDILPEVEKGDGNG